MNNLFNSLEAVFKVNSALVAVGRRLVRSKTQSGPHTLVENGPTETLNTFDNDITLYRVTFTYVGKRGIVATNADTWLTQMMASFDDAVLTSAAWTCCSCRRVEKRESKEVDGRYQAALDYEIIVQLN